MRFVRTEVSAERAWRRLHRPPLTRLRRVARRIAGRTEPAPQQLHGKLPYLEVVWLPSHLLTFRTELSERPAHALVGGFDGTCTVTDLRTVRWEDAPEREVFVPSIDTDNARTIAAGQLARMHARRPGLRGRSVPAAESSELVQYPYWVYYYGRRPMTRWKRRIDLRLLDAVTGQPAGARAKNGFLTALSSTRAAVTSRENFVPHSPLSLHSGSTR